MADVIGPSNYKTGQDYRGKIPDGMKCEDHPDRPATHAVVGETDSFGSEIIHWCDECYAAHKKERNKQ